MVRLPLSPETYRLLQLAAEYHELSDGAFDITTAPFSYAWGFYDVETPEEPPAPEQLDALLKHIGMRHLKLDSRSAELTSQHTRIEVDQLLKAYALDMTILALQRYEVNGILVEIDGHARCIGEPPGGGPWHLPLRYTAATDSLLGTIALTNGQACASLHHDDRLITIGGKEYTRIIDPLTGWPVEKTQAVVTIGPTATKATALAKTLFALGADELGIARRFTHCEALIVPRSNAEDAFMTPGFRAQLDAATAPQINLHVVRE
jgi:thiamine biosynthesis lipoprotein